MTVHLRRSVAARRRSLPVSPAKLLPKRLPLPLPWMPWAGPVIRNNMGKTAKAAARRRPQAKGHSVEEQVLLGHGSGGTMMKRIIDEVFFQAYAGDELRRGDDAAVLDPQCALAAAGEGFSTFSTGSRLAFSTDSFVVTPHFFPGGDIGRLAVCGTVNDVATSGAAPLYLSCGFILEEGYPIKDLQRICGSMAEAAREAGVRVVTGDTKVVNRGHGDGVFINTSGVGVIPAGLELSGAFCRPGDKVLVTGTLGDHGITIMSCRESLSFSAQVESDAAPLNHLIADVLRATGSVGSPSPVSENSTATPQDCTASSTLPAPVRCFRDPTRGGLASTLNELAAQSQVDITVDEDAIPVNDAVLGACDMLGYDVLQVANEGKMVCVTAPDVADAALDAMRQSPYGRDAAIIGEVGEMRPDRGPKVYVRNGFGGRRILDMLVGEQLPRIC